MWLGDLNFPYCFLEWLLTYAFYSFTSFHSFVFKLTLTIYWPFSGLSFVLVPYIHLSFHTAAAILQSITAHRQSKIWWAKIWKVILLLSLAECFELSLCITEWCSSVHPLPPILLLAGQQSVSLICVSMNESLREESLPLEKRLKSFLCHLLRGKCPFKPLPSTHHLGFFFYVPRMNFVLSTPNSPEAIVSMQTHYWDLQSHWPTMLSYLANDKNDINCTPLLDY